MTFWREPQSCRVLCRCRRRAGQKPAARFLPTQIHRFHRGRPGRRPLHQPERQSQDPPQDHRWSRNSRRGAGSRGHVRRTRPLRSKPENLNSDHRDRGKRGHDGSPRVTGLDRCAPQDRATAAAGAGASTTTHQQHPVRPDLHRRTRTGSQTTTRPGDAIRNQARCAWITNSPKKSSLNSLVPHAKPSTRHFQTSPNADGFTNKARPSSSTNPTNLPAALEHDPRRGGATV
jgi:hypothetical protein